MYNNVGVLVDGRAEQLFFEAALPGCRVRRILPNGRNVSLELIGEKIIDGHNSFGGYVDTLIAKLDREQRPASCSTMAQELKSILDKAKISRPTILAIADRCLENWILADDARISELTGSNYTYCHEGRMGKSTLSNILSQTSMSFVETSRHLLSSKASNISASSVSFDAFSKNVHFSWYWIEQ